MRALLKDGTTIEENKGCVFVVCSTGEVLPIPDGVHELKNRTRIETVGGMLVHGTVSNGIEYRKAILEKYDEKQDGYELNFFQRIFRRKH